MPKSAKLERCIKKVKAQSRSGGKKVNPFAICHASVGKKRRKR